MKKFFRLILIIPVLLVYLLMGCEENNPSLPSRAVIEGWIDSDGHPVVIFTASISPDEGEVNVADKVVRWGRVTLSDGIDTILLTGSPNYNYYPPYIYFDSEMKGVPGREYTLTADFEELHARAKCRMPLPVSINRIEVSPFEGNDSLRNVSLSFIAPDDSPAYFYVAMRERSSNGRSLPSLLSTIEADTPGEEIIVPIYRPKSEATEMEYESQLKIGEEWEIKLCRISEEVFRFWEGYENEVLFGGTQFINSSYSTRGNIEGGYGVWSAQGVSKQTIKIL